MSKAASPLVDARKLSALASDINREHESATACAVKALEHARRCGELLIEAKGQCQHGEWLPWLEGNCSVSARQAQRYMKVAKNWDAIEDKNDATSHLTIDGAIRALSAGATSESPAAQIGRMLDAARESSDDSEGFSQSWDDASKYAGAWLHWAKERLSSLESLPPDDVYATCQAIKAEAENVCQLFASEARKFEQEFGERVHGLETIDLAAELADLEERLSKCDSAEEWRQLEARISVLARSREWLIGDYITIGRRYGWDWSPEAFGISRGQGERMADVCEAFQQR